MSVRYLIKDCRQASTFRAGRWLMGMLSAAIEAVRDVGKGQLPCSDDEGGYEVSANPQICLGYQTGRHSDESKLSHCQKMTSLCICEYFLSVLIMANGTELQKRDFLLIDRLHVLFRPNIEAVTEGKYQRVYQETGHTRAMWLLLLFFLLSRSV